MGTHEVPGSLHAAPGLAVPWLHQILGGSPGEGTDFKLGWQGVSRWGLPQGIGEEQLLPQTPVALVHDGQPARDGPSAGALGLPPSASSLCGVGVTGGELALVRLRS